MSEKTNKVLKVFHEATCSDRGGEVVLRCGEHTGRVFFVGGKIAWVTVSTITRTFTTYLVDNTRLSSDEVQEVFADCKRTGKNFGETIIEWGLLEEDALRGFLLRHLSECLLEVFSWPEVDSMFMPEDRTYKGSLTFDLEELVDSVMQLDEEGKLPFSGQATSAIMKGLRHEREPTQPHIPAFEGGEEDEYGQTATEQIPETQSLAEPIPDEPLPPAEEPVPHEPSPPAAEPAPPEPTPDESLPPAAEPAPPEPTPDESLPPAAEPAPPEPMPTPVPDAPKRFRLARFFILGVLLVTAVVGAYLGTEYFFGDGSEASGPATGIVDEPDTGEDAGTGPAAVLDAGKEGQPAGQAADGRAAAGGLDGGTQDAASQLGTGGEDADVGGNAPATGSLRVTSQPAKGFIFLDGIYTGQRTPHTLEEVTRGEHVVLVVKRRWAPAFAKLTIEPGVEALAALGLRRKDRRFKGRIKVWLQSEPPGAKIFVNGGRVSKPTPTAIYLKAKKSSKLELRKRGYENWVRGVMPVPGEKLIIRAELDKR